MKKKTLRALALAAFAATAVSQAYAVEPAAADSSSQAMAAIVADYLLPALDRQYPADDVAVQMFADGVSKAFEIQSADEVFYQGLAQGLKIRDSIDRLRGEGYAIDNVAFMAALKAAIAGKPTGFTAASATRYLDKKGAEIRQAELSKQQAWLDEQASREGVVRQPSGLLFEVISEGVGEHPTIDDTVEVLYTGKLADGTVFDSHDAEPIKFPVKGLIKGFAEGLTMMRPGGTYRLVIPSEIGYGEQGAGGGLIPPGAALDFNVTLIGVVE